MQINADKCSEMQINATVLHEILGAVADHWSLGVIAIFGPQTGHHSSQPHWRHGSTRQCQARAPLPQGSGRDSR